MKYTLMLSTLVFSAGARAQALDFNRIMTEDRAAGTKIVQIEQRPTLTKDLSAQYDFTSFPLKTNEAIYLIIPTELATRPIDFISVAHRQDPRDENECPGAGQRDCKPGYTSVEVYWEGDPTHAPGWRCWGGRGSGPCNSKFAEIRADTPETDNLYEWRKKGHIALNGRDHSKAELRPALLRIRSVGPDQVLIHKLILKVMPPTPTLFDVVNFSGGFSFGDFETAEGRRYPGSPENGNYGTALDLSRSAEPRHHEMRPDWTVRRGTFELPLRAGKRLIAVDLAVGDMRPVPPGANPEKFRGNATISMEIYRNGVLLKTLMENENVGENGLMRGSPDKLDEVLRDGDRLRIRATRGEAHIMGLRVGYGD